MNLKFILSSILLLSTSFLYGAGPMSKDSIPPEQKIIGSNESPVEVGEIAAVTLSSFDRTKFPEITNVTIDWLVQEVNYEVVNNKKTGNFVLKDKPIFIDNKNRACFGTGAIPNKRIFLTAFVIYQYKDNSLGRAILTDKIEVAPSPTPPEPPEPPTPPTPPPEPKFPDGKYKLSIGAYKSFIKVDNSVRLNAAQGLATAMRGQASKIRAGAAAKDLEKCLDETGTANAKKLKEIGVDITISSLNINQFFDFLENELGTLNDSGKLVTTTDLATALDELAIGLEGVK